MTIGEFKAFLDGMDIEGTPTEDQWARIKAKIDRPEPLSWSEPYKQPFAPTYEPMPPLAPHFTVTC